MKLSNLTLFGGILLFWVTVAVAAPEIAIDQPNFDFGSIHQGKKVEHVFILRNKGDVPLTIKSVRPSCGCTAASITTSVISPGATVGITALFDSANFTGAIRKSITVDTNDPRIPASILTLSGTVVEEIQINPKQLNLGQIKINETTRTTIFIKNMGSKQIRIASVKSSLPQIVAISDKKLLNPGESSKISVSIYPRDGDRLLSGYLTVTTDNPAKPDILVPVYGSAIF